MAFQCASTIPSLERRERDRYPPSTASPTSIQREKKTLSPSATVQDPASPCPACRGTRFRKLFTKKAHDFWKCEGCGLERQQPLPSQADLKAFYEQSYTGGLYKEFASALEIKRLTAAYRFRAIREICPGQRWLDVGASNGVFVEYLRERGIDAHGIDLSERAVAQARARGLPVEASLPEDYRPERPFDVVTCFDLIEHAIDPVASMRAIHRLLIPGGKVVITLPNQGSAIRRVMGPRWFFYIPEEHLHYFNPSNIRRLMARTGFETERVGPIAKPLSYRYSLVQFAEYNPALHRALSSLSRALPSRLLDWVMPLHIGEMLVVAHRESAPGA
jgi:2-polyprenyl-3-methyl-5-hydroxy-6-metoxy-1,4-benzoquinol methylase